MISKKIVGKILSLSGMFIMLLLIISLIAKSFYYGFIISVLFFIAVAFIFCISASKKIYNFIIYVSIFIVVIIILFALVYENSPTNQGRIIKADCNITNQSYQLSPNDYLYFSGVTFTTLGYGDLKPIGTLRFVALLETFLGWAVLALLIYGIYEIMNKKKEPNNKA